MTTSPPKSNLSAFAFGEDDESTVANQEYKNAMDKLRQAYKARSEESLFDPKWLAAAQGFAKPTQTGSFFESLGNVAGNLSKAQEDQQTKAEELAKMELELAGMGVGQANQRAAMKMYKEGAEPPAVGQQPASLSSGVLKSMGIEDQGVQVAPAVPLIPEKQFIASQLSKGGNIFDAKIAYDKYVRDDIKIAQNGMLYQGSTGRLFDMPDPTPLDVPFFTLNGDTFKTTKTLARKLDALTAAGDQEGRIALENQIRGIGKKPPPVAKPVVPYARPVTENPPMGQIQSPLIDPSDRPASLTQEQMGNPPAQVRTGSVAPAQINATPTVAAAPAPAPAPAPVPASTPAPVVGMRSPAQLTKEAADAAARRDMNLRVEEARLKAEQEKKDLKPNMIAKAEAEGEVKTRQEIEDNRKESFTTLTYANQFRKYAELPGAEKMFGILNREGIAPAIAKLVESGVGVRGYTVGIPAIEDVMRNANLSPAEQAQYRSFLQLATQLQLQRAKYMKGSVSNYEQTILADAGITAQDTPEAIRRKADIMSARALFDRQVAQKQDKFKGDALQFLKSDEYTQMVLDYDAKLMRIISGQTEMKPREQRQPPSQSKRSSISAADAALGIR